MKRSLQHRSFNTRLLNQQCSVSYTVLGMKPLATQVTVCKKYMFSVFNMYCKMPWKAETYYHHLAWPNINELPSLNCCFLLAVNAFAAYTVIYQKALEKEGLMKHSTLWVICPRVEIKMIITTWLFRGIEFIWALMTSFSPSSTLPQIMLPVPQLNYMPSEVMFLSYSPASETSVKILVFKHSFLSERQNH